MSRTNLISRFAAAKLPLELTAAPLTRGGGMRDIVQLDIARPDRRVRQERFLLWGGHEDNRIEVEGVDKHLRQLVLMVHEPRRAFEVQYSTRREVPTGHRVVRRTKDFVWLQHFTDERKRHFLTGMDESHLFVAQLPRPVSTVWAAHLALKSDVVRVAERGVFERTVRQGEWFFVDLNRAERAEVDDAAKKFGARLRRGTGIAEAAQLRRAGRPHVADEVLVQGDRIYVRGSVRHPDHATVTFRLWRRAIVNTEAFTQPIGVSWID